MRFTTQTSSPRIKRIPGDLQYSNSITSSPGIEKDPHGFCQSYTVCRSAAFAGITCWTLWTWKVEFNVIRDWMQGWFQYEYLRCSRWEVLNTISSLTCQRIDPQLALDFGTGQLGQQNPAHQFPDSAYISKATVCRRLAQDCPWHDNQISTCCSSSAKAFFTYEICLILAWSFRIIRFMPYRFSWIPWSWSSKCQSWSWDLDACF